MEPKYQEIQNKRRLLKLRHEIEEMELDLEYIKHSVKHGDARLGELMVKQREVDIELKKYKFEIEQKTYASHCS